MDRQHQLMGMDQPREKKQSRSQFPPVYIVDGVRTPYLKVSQGPGPFSASDLAVWAARDLLMRHARAQSKIDEVLVGCVMPRETEANIGRLVALRAGCGEATPGWTVQRNCGSGLQAIDAAYQSIAMGRSDVVLAGGTEAMSRSPLILQDEMVKWMCYWQTHQRDWWARCLSLLNLRWRHVKPMLALRTGLRDPLCHLSMGETAEILAHQFQITRSEMDAFAYRSQRRLWHAERHQYFKSERIALFDRTGHCYQHDEGQRPNTSLEKLAQLPTVFDRFGQVTAGNSSQITDGAAMLLLASESAVKKYQLPVLGRIMDIEWAALSPRVMGLGPVFAATPLLQRHHLQLKDIDYWEINEAFAATVIGCMRAWASDVFCKQHFGLSQAYGELDPEKLNVDGGAIAIGHPVGSSGARIVLHLLHILQRTDKRRGVAALCIGGGQGGALLLERV